MIFQALFSKACGECQKGVLQTSGHWFSNCSRLILPCLAYRDVFRILYGWHSYRGDEEIEGWKGNCKPLVR